MSASDPTESAAVFECCSDRLVGVMHLPSDPVDVGVVVVVGGPQYRVGSHRQFLLLARQLALDGIAVFRFDYRGMGDSDGQLRGFEFIADDIRAAIDEFMRLAPQVKRIVLWGLCDGATAAAAYAPLDPRVHGLVLLNPWVRSDQTLARSIVFHYYARRVLDAAAWRRLLGNWTALRDALNSFASSIKKVASADRAGDVKSSVGSAKDEPTQREAAATASKGAASGSLVVRTATALDAFNGPILTILSGADITANEFVEATKANRRMRRRLNRSTVTRHVLPPADHTFSTAHWRDQVARWTTAWLRTL